MVGLVALPQSPQNGNGVFDTGFADEDLLEAPFQSGVLFDPFAVLVQGGGANHSQLTPSQHWLEHVASIH